MQRLPLTGSKELFWLTCLLRLQAGALLPGPGTAQPAWPIDTYTSIPADSGPSEESSGMMESCVVCSAGACIEALLRMLCSSTCANFRDLEATLDAVHMKVPPIRGAVCTSWALPDVYQDERCKATKGEFAVFAGPELLFLAHNMPLRLAGDCRIVAAMVSMLPGRRC